jgi:GINS complex subunit 4
LTFRSYHFISFIADIYAVFKIELIEHQTYTADPKSSFKLIILQTELERFKFLIRSFLRSRLAKIDAYTLHHLTDPPTRVRLSESEIQYATAHSTLLHRHYYSSFLGQFPEALRRLDDRQGGVDMVEGPDLEKAVFVRGLGGPQGEAVEVEVEGTDIGFRMGRGDVWVVRWGAVRGAVARREAELI